MQFHSTMRNNEKGENDCLVSSVVSSDEWMIDSLLLFSISENGAQDDTTRGNFTRKCLAVKEIFDEPAEWERTERLDDLPTCRTKNEITAEMEELKKSVEAKEVQIKLTETSISDATLRFTYFNFMISD